MEVYSEVPNDEVNINPSTYDKDYVQSLSVEEALVCFETSSKGLTPTKAIDRVQIYGLNKLSETKKNKILVFLGFMWNPLSWCMEIAALLSIVLLDYIDFVLIMSLLFINACIGFYEENNADNAIRALMASLAPKARVLRDHGHHHDHEKENFEDIEAENLVPGDIILVRLGDILPADIKLLGTADDEPMLIDQSALTGESIPVKKESGEIGFSGSIVKQGEMKALVYATGSNSFFGRAASLIDGTKSQGNIQKILNLIGGACVITIALWVTIELIVQLLYRKHECSFGEGNCPTFQNVLVLICGGIPVAMPTVLSVTLALGAGKLAKKGAIVSRLSAIEQLAGMDMLCSDKTGTLTLNQLTVDFDNVKSFGKFSKKDVLLYGALSARIENHEPIDVSIHTAYEHNYDQNLQIWEQYECTRYIPFNPVSKKTTAFIQEINDTNNKFLAVKGSPQIALGLAYNVDDISDDVNAKILEMALRGYRAIGIAISKQTNADGENIFEFVGLVPIYDPPRHDTKETISKCKELGVEVKMITGDQLPIGIETSKLLGLGTAMHTGDVFNENLSESELKRMLKAKGSRERKSKYIANRDNLLGSSEENSETVSLLGSDDDGYSLDDLCEDADGFAEVFPEHKYEIVQRLQKRGHITGMTGDGVNDAPALKKSDIGIAVDDSTDAARSAASIVLTKPGLSVIADGIVESRRIFQKMKNFAKYTVAMTIRICFTFGWLTAYYDWNFPTLLIVLFAILNDGAMITVSKDIVKPSKTPDSWNIKGIFCTGLVYGLYLTVSSFCLFYMAAETSFFDKFNLKSVDIFGATEYCESLTSVSNFDQCESDIVWERQSTLRAIMYLHVSITGQALIFITRTKGFSLIHRPGYLLLIAFFSSQAIATTISYFGFNGWPFPKNDVSCEYCQYFSGQSPLENSASVSSESVIGCGGWVIVVWVWSLLWYLPLDLIKIVMAVLLNDDVPSIKRSKLLRIMKIHKS